MVQKIQTRDEFYIGGRHQEDWIDKRKKKKQTDKQKNDLRKVKGNLDTSRQGNRARERNAAREK